MMSRTTLRDPIVGIPLASRADHISSVVHDMRARAQTVMSAKSGTCANITKALEQLHTYFFFPAGGFHLLRSHCRHRHSPASSPCPDTGTLYNPVNWPVYEVHPGQLTGLAGIKAFRPSFVRSGSVRSCPRQLPPHLEMTLVYCSRDFSTLRSLYPRQYWSLTTEGGAARNSYKCKYTPDGVHKPDRSTTVSANSPQTVPNNCS